MWLIDSEGHIQFSANEEEIGKDITELLPASVTSDVLDKSNKKVITDKKWNEEGFEFAKMKVGTTDFIILIAAPTDELTILLNPIRYNAIILGIVFFIFTLFIVYLLTNSISKPLVNITTLAGNFATGNLTQPIKSELLSRSDEIGNLSRAFKEMKNQISKMILQVKHSAQIVSEGSAVLTQSSHKLSSSATQQASATEEVSASMEEMSSNITQNAENAKITEDIMSKATTDTERGGEIVIKTVDAIKNINENVRIIEDIAMQTNLLALNAAVEAARAGEHGKGFAVVASEVRKLAERSRESALKINELSGSSVEIAERAGEIFTNLVPGVKKSFSLVGEISAASNEQDIGANQVNNAIMELDKVSQSNAAAAENISQLTTEFVNEVNKLQMAIRFFQVEENQSIAGIELANNNKENF